MFDSRGVRILNRTAWDARASEIRTGWEQFLTGWDFPRRPPEYEILATDRLPRVTRRLIRYQSERNVTVEAYLIEPNGINLRVPGVVVFHSTVDYTIRQSAGLEGDPSKAWGLRLAERGFVTLSPRCFLWDGTQPPNYQAQVEAHLRRHPGTRGMTKMLYDVPPRTRSVGQSRPGRSRAARRRGTFAGCQRNALPGGVRSPRQSRRVQRRWAQPRLFQLGRPLVSGVQAAGTRPSRATGTGGAARVPGDRWRRSRRRQELAPCGMRPGSLSHVRRAGCASASTTTAKATRFPQPPKAASISGSRRICRKIGWRREAGKKKNRS